MSEKQILIVDDDPVNRNLFFQFAKFFGLQAQTASTVQEAYQKMDIHPDIVLTDFRLSPKGSEGWDIARSALQKKISQIIITSADKPPPKEETPEDLREVPFVTKDDLYEWLQETLNQQPELVSK